MTMTINMIPNDVPVLRIDIISDVMCPWCAIGYMGLKQALAEMSNDIVADIHWQPFELNPTMPSEGQDLAEHIHEKYGSTPQQSQQNRDHITQLGNNLGFEFNFSAGRRIYNTFKAHQLIHWVGEEYPERQTELKMALLVAYFKEGKDVSDNKVLLAVIEELDFDANLAKSLLEDEVYAGDVRALQEQWRQLGVSAVPSFIIDEKYMISGGQPKEAFVQALSQIIES